MNAKMIALGIGILAFAGASFVLIRDMGKTDTSATASAAVPAPSIAVEAPISAPEVDVPSSPNPDAGLAEGGVKEIAMDSWMEMKSDGTMSAHFSLPEIRVKKGDRVRVAITNTKGTHDFVIDELGVKQDTPEGQTTVVEFVADKAGSFEYYCSKYSHRLIGQKGTLIVTE